MSMWRLQHKQQTGDCQRQQNTRDEQHVAIIFTSAIYLVMCVPSL